MQVNWPSRGTAMMLVGGLMVAFAIATMLASSDRLPVPVAVIGLVFIAVGSRKRRTNSRTHHPTRP
jgi:hypothetical protein